MIKVYEKREGRKIYTDEEIDKEIKKYKVENHLATGPKQNGKPLRSS